MLLAGNFLKNKYKNTFGLLFDLMFFPRPMDDLTAGLIQKNEEQEKKDLRTKENKKEQFLMQHFSLKESTLKG